MTGVDRRALAFFASCVGVSVILEGIDAGGVHSVALRLAATFSFVIGLVVLLVRAQQANNRQRAEKDD